MGEFTPPEVGQQAALDAALDSSVKTDPISSLPALGRKPGLKTTLMTTALGLAVAGCGMFGLNTGGAGKSGESQVPVIPPPSAEVSDSPVPTATNSENPTIVVPTASPTEAPTPTEAAELVKAPAIPGLKAELQSGKVIYVAEAGNRYGLKVDGKTEVAAYNPDVSVEGAQVGGLALESHVAAWYLQNTADVNGIPPILSPVDLRTAKGVTIRNGTIQNLQGGIFPDIEITTQEATASVNSILPGTRSLDVSPNSLYGTSVVDSKFAAKGSDEWTSLTFLAQGLPTLSESTKFSLGQKIGGVTGPVRIAYRGGGAGNYLSINSSAMLSIGNSIVSAFN